MSGRVEKSLDAAQDLLEGLLDIARLDTGSLHAVNATFSVGELLASLHEQFAPLARQRGICFEIVPTQAVGYSDQRLVRRILQNFISNALRYTRSGRVVMGVRRRENGCALELQVWDTGPGIPPEDRESIFDEYRRLARLSPWGEQGSVSGCRSAGEWRTCWARS